MTTRKAITPPRGHEHRVSMARHRPEALTLNVCDIACLLDVSLGTVYSRDAKIKPAWLGTRMRRYSWAKYLAYLAIVDGTPAGD